MTMRENYVMTSECVFRARAGGRRAAIGGDRGAPHYVSVSASVFVCLPDSLSLCLSLPFSLSLSLSSAGIGGGRGAPHYVPDLPENDALYMCVLTKKELLIYSSEGDAFSVALPFTARRMWELGKSHTHTHT